jgi:hypothetical protein
MTEWPKPPEVPQPRMPEQERMKRMAEIKSQIDTIDKLMKRGRKKHGLSLDELQKKREALSREREKLFSEASEKED